MSKDGKGITCGMEPWSIRQFCGVPAASVSMQHTVDRSLQVKARALVTFSRIAAGAMFDANLARRGRRHGPGLVQVRPKGRHLRGNGQVRSDVGCASGHDIRVHESRNRLSMTSTEIEQNEMSPAALGPAVDGDKAAALATPFVECLVRLVRAHESSGSREGKLDPELLADFIITKELRRKIRSSAIRIRTRCGGSYTARGACDRGAVRRDGIANNRDETNGAAGACFYGRQLVVLSRRPPVRLRDYPETGGCRYETGRR